MLYAGLDFGRQVDHSALTIVEATPTTYAVDVPYRRPSPTGPVRATRREIREGLPASYAVRHLERWALGTPTPVVIDDVKARLDAVGPCGLAIDATGQGFSLVDFAHERGVPGLPVIMTAGETGYAGDDAYYEPRNSLLMRLVVAFEAGRLTIAEGLDLGTVWAEELQGIVQARSAAGRLTMQHQEAGHDDLVVATGLAVLLAEHVILERSRKYGRIVGPEEAQDDMGLTPPR